MSGAAAFGLCGAAVAGIGLYGLLFHPHPLRKLLAVNLLASGMFLILGVVARRGAAAGFGGDPVPQALLITAIVVSFAATALAIGLLAPAVRDERLRDPAPRDIHERRARSRGPKTSPAIYLGIHWRFDKTEGIDQGQQVAHYVVDPIFLPRH